MRNFFTNAAFFLILCLALSTLSSCEQPGNVAGGNNGKPSTTNGGPKPPVNSGAPSSGKTEYPPLRTGMAEAEYELLDGTKINVAGKKGQVLLLNLWGIWCGPCRAEMPHLVELHTKYRDQGFEVIGLNVGDSNGSPENVDAIKKFAADMKLNYTLARSANESTKHFYLLTKQQVVPQSIVVDREGKLRGVFIGGGANVIQQMKTTVEKTMTEQPG